MFCQKLNDCLQSRIELSDQKLIRDGVSVLENKGWKKLVEEHNKIEGIDRLLTRFAIPLQGAHADCSEIKEEFRSLLQYAVQSNYSQP